MLYSGVQGSDCITENHPTTLFQNQTLIITTVVDCCKVTPSAYVATGTNIPTNQLVFNQADTSADHMETNPVILSVATNVTDKHYNSK